jgi:hypothetical protein
MEDLFRSYFWLLFPLGWFVAEGWQSWLRYRARKDALRLLQTYAQNGQTPPEDLVKAIAGQDPATGLGFGVDAAGGESRPSTTNWGWYQVALFGALAGGLVFLARSGIVGDEGLADAMVVAAVILGALALASLVYAFTWKGPKA